MYAFLPIQYGSGNSAFMALGFPSTQVYAEGNRLLRNNLISLGVVAVFSLSAAWLFGDLLIIIQVKPLLHAVKAWTAGDLQVRIHKQKGPLVSVECRIAGELGRRRGSKAALWGLDKKPGEYDMFDVLGL